MVTLLFYYYVFFLFFLFFSSRRFFDWFSWLDFSIGVFHGVVRNQIFFSLRKECVFPLSHEKKRFAGRAFGSLATHVAHTIELKLWKAFYVAHRPKLPRYPTPNVARGLETKEIDLVV